MTFLLVFVLISRFRLAGERRFRLGRRIVLATSGGRRFEGDGAGHTRTDQHTLGHIIEMDAHRIR
jgi:hypothetical protein